MEEKHADEQKGARYGAVLKITIGLILVVLVYALDVASHTDKRTQFIRLEGQAYEALYQFAPWSAVQRYFQIVTMPDGSQNELATQAQQFHDAFRSTRCSMDRLAGISEASDPGCRADLPPRGLAAFYLSSHVPFVLRLITAFIDILIHAFVDRGLIGFLVVAAQVAIGFFITAYLIWRKTFTPDSFYSFVLGVPLLALAAGSLAAAPIWILAVIGKALFEGSPLAQLSFQGICTVCVVYFCKKKAETAVEEFLVKFAQRFLR